MTGEHLLSCPVDVRAIPREGIGRIVTASPDERARIAKRFGLVDLVSLEANFRLKPESGKRVRVTGRLTANVVQTCVVSLVPVAQQMDEPIDITLVPASETTAPSAEEEIIDALGREAPEPFDGRTIDLGAIAVEHFALGLDPYPRAPGVEFNPPKDDGDAASWAARLSSLAGRRGDEG